ncbi:MAG: SDR family NAD(P)-dependent oxidoreductase [Thermoproteota archaeon]
MTFQEEHFLVTGGAGFIGNEVVRQLLAEGSTVTVLDNFSSGKKNYLPNHKKLKIIHGDITNTNDIKKAVKNQEVVINLAALPFIPDSYKRPADFFNVNTIGSVNMILESIKSKTVERFVQISTSEVYGNAQKIPMDENHPTFPHSTYAVSKLAADRAAFTLHKEHNFPTVIIRPFNSFGPRFTQPYIIPEIIKQISTNDTLKLGNLQSSRDFTFVSDTTRAILNATKEKNAIGQVINVGSGYDVTILKLANTILKLVNKKSKIVIDKKRKRPFDVNKLVCDNSKAKKILKWNPTISLEEGLKQTLTWAKNTKLITN